MAFEAKTVKFISKCHNQVITIVPKRVTIQDGMAIGTPGKRAEFTNGEFETSDKKDINFLRQHELNGRGFWEVTEEDKAAIQAASQVIPDFNTGNPPE